MLFRVCAKNEVERQRHRRLLQGNWIHKDLFALNGANVAAQEVVSALKPQLRIVNRWGAVDLVETLADEARGRAADVGAGFNLFLVSEQDRCGGLETINYYRTCQSGVVSDLTSICLLNLWPKTSMENSVETAIIACLLCRSQMQINLTVLIRTISRIVAKRRVNLERLQTTLDGLGNKFASAALRLAVRGFKSRRFVARKLKPGEPVIAYYDKYRVLECRTKRAVGYVDSIYSSDCVILTGGVSIRYGLEHGQVCDVWPCNR